MKKIIFALFLIVPLLIATAAYADFGIRLYINGNEIQSDVPPMIINDRTMVPARVVFENLDATVDWNPDTRQVTVKSSSGTNIVLTIGEKQAAVGGKTVTMDVAPMILSDRTMLPIRFVSENLGYDVNWNPTSKSVYISAPLPKYTNEIKSVDVSDGESSSSVVIKLASAATPKVMTLESPYRIVLDFAAASINGKDTDKTVDGVYIHKLRWALHDDYSRIVIEPNGDRKYEITGSGTDSITVRISGGAPDDDNPSKPNETPPAGNPSKPGSNPGTSKPVSDGYIVAIDAGHGGKDVGAIAKDENGDTITDSNGNPILTEKTVNLYIARKIRDNLVARNVKVIMTRDDDTFVGTNMENLLARAEMANSGGAQLFVSVHNNSAASPNATGTEICYTSESTGASGITSKELAQNILGPLVAATGLANRGLVDRPNLVVLKYTSMPAVLIECGFVSCEKDREVLMSTAKLDEIAAAVADAIVVSLGKLKK